MVRFGLGSVLGAGAAGAYGMQQLNNAGPSTLWGFLPKDWALTGGQQGGLPPANSAEMAMLQNEMRRLAGMVGDLARTGNRPTVVHLGGRSGWSIIVVPAVAGGAVLYLYCRFTGNSIWDLLYVSRSSLSQFKTTVQEGMTKMWEEMRRQKEEVLRMVTSLGRKQDELKDSQEQLMAKQDQMDERLRRVDDTCYNLDSKANHTIERVQKLDTRLQDVHVGVQAANQGIFMLVSAVSEVTQKIGLHNSRTAQALKNYIQGGPAWQTAAVGGGAPVQQLPSTLSSSGNSSSIPVSGSSGAGLPPGLRSLMGGHAAGPEAPLTTAATAMPGLKAGHGLDSAPSTNVEVMDRAATYHPDGVTCVVQELPASPAEPAAAATHRLAGAGLQSRGLKLMGF